MFVLIFVPNKKIKQNIMKTLEFKNLELDNYTRRGKFRNWVLFFDEVSGDEPVRFSVDFIEEWNWDKQIFEPVALDENSAATVKMFFKNTENANNVLFGFFLRVGVQSLIDTDWTAWKVRQTVDLF